MGLFAAGGVGGRNCRARRANLRGDICGVGYGDCDIRVDVRGLFGGRGED